MQLFDAVETKSLPMSLSKVCRVARRQQETGGSSRRRYKGKYDEIEKSEDDKVEEEGIVGLKGILSDR
jgi:hypothetical protein